MAAPELHHRFDEVEQHLSDQDAKIANSRSVGSGAGIGALIAVLIVGFAHRLSLTISPEVATLLSAAMIAGGAWAFHILGQWWAGPGIWPAIKRGLLGDKP